MRISIILVFIFLTIQLFGQRRPEYIPSQFEEIAQPCFCKPGLDKRTKSKAIEFSYGIIGRGEFESENETVLTPPFTDITSRRELLLKFKVPIVNIHGFKLLAGYSYKNEQYKIKSVGTEFSETIDYLNNLDLRSVGLSIQFVKSLDEKSYISGKISQGFNGDFDGVFDLQSEHRTFQAAALYGYKFSDAREAGIGLVYSQNFVDTQVIPFVRYMHNFAPHWGVEAVLPLSIYLKNYRDEKTIVSIGAEYSGNIFNISYTNASDQVVNYAFDHAGIAGTILIEKQIVPWVWFYSKIGFQTNLSSTFDPLNVNSTIFEVDQTDTPFFKLSLFISPPNSFFK